MENLRSRNFTEEADVVDVKFRDPVGSLDGSDERIYKLSQS